MGINDWQVAVCRSQGDVNYKGAMVVFFSCLFLFVFLYYIKSVNIFLLLLVEVSN